jgi:hypothetical protein
VDKERLHVAATRSCTDANRVIHGETQSEIPLALSIMTIKFLHMGPAFRRNPDISQVIRSKKCKKKSIKGSKCKNTSFFVRVALQRIPSPRVREPFRRSLPFPEGCAMRTMGRSDDRGLLHRGSALRRPFFWTATAMISKDLKILNGV